MLLFEVKDHDEVISAMEQHITSSYTPFNASQDIFVKSPQEMRRQGEPSERVRMQDRRVPFPFRGDGELDAPPLAWTVVWGGTYSNLYGRYLPDGMRQWGYVFWDAATLERARGREILKRQWEERSWDSFGPRENWP